MARLLIHTQVFPPEIHSTSVMVKELAEYLSRKEWDVEVICGQPHHPNGILPTGWKKELFKVYDGEGYRVLRTWHLTSRSRSIPVRAGVYLSQALGTALGAALVKRKDIVLIYGPPLVGPLLGAIVAKMHGAKLVNVVYDIYPDVAVETGKVKNPLVVGAAKIAEQIQYKTADLTIVLSDGFKRQLVEKGVSEERIAVIPVWLDADEIVPKNRDNAWRRNNDIPVEKFVVLYAGTMGVVSGATVVAEAAHLLRDREEILFLMVGEGEEKPKLVRRAQELGLKNIKFLPIQPREVLAEVQATADIGLVTLLKGKGRTSVPSKVQGYMAAGRPVIGSVDQDSDTAMEISDNDFGIVVQPENPRAMAEAIVELHADGERCEKLGGNARDRLVEQYSKDRNLLKYEEFLRSLLAD